MKISTAGLDQLIKPFEGYLTRQDDGSCRAYQCPAGVWTCGWGCTEGVTPDTHWTAAEATVALAREMAKHELQVAKLLNVGVTQSQFDALVSLSYNVGAGAVGKSTLMRHLNAGDAARAATHFADFKYSRVTGSVAKRMNVAPGTKVVLAGLVRRRAKEAEWFLTGADTPMPQKVEAPDAKWKLGEAVQQVGIPVAATGAVAVEGARQVVPVVPQVATRALESANAWRDLVSGVRSIAMDLAGLPWKIVAVAAMAGGGALAYRRWRRRA